MHFHLHFLIGIIFQYIKRLFFCFLFGLSFHFISFSILFFSSLFYSILFYSFPFFLFFSISFYSFLFHHFAHSLLSDFFRYFFYKKRVTLLRQNLNTRPWLVNTTQTERVSDHVTHRISPLDFNNQLRQFFMERTGFLAHQRYRRLTIS